MPNHGVKPDELTRRTALASLVLTVAGTLTRPALAQSSAINDIIKGLAPIEGQIVSGQYQPIKREPVIVEDGTIYVDAARHVDLEVYFAYDSDEITLRARDQLRGLGEALESDLLSRFRYLVAGHSDAVGSDAYNIDLSARRARAVFAYLTENYSIDPSRLMTVGFGFRRLKRPDAPYAAINRRVEILMIVI